MLYPEYRQPDRYLLYKPTFLQSRILWGVRNHHTHHCTAVHGHTTKQGQISLLYVYMYHTSLDAILLLSALARALLRCFIIC